MLMIMLNTIYDDINEYSNDIDNNNIYDNVNKYINILYIYVIR